MEWLQDISYWHWWILAGILLIIEVTAPTAFFLWLGIAAAATGVLKLVFPAMTLEWQTLMFGIFSAISVVVWWRYRENQSPESDQPALNQRGHQYIGRTFTLDEAIENGVGKVIVDDTTWRVRGNDMPAGKRVKVVGVDGVIFSVEPIVE